MTNKECVERWAEQIIPAVFRAEDALLKNKPEWKERIANATDDNVSEVAREYCTEIAEIIVRGAEDFDDYENDRPLAKERDKVKVMFIKD